MLTRSLIALTVVLSLSSASSGADTKSIDLLEKVADFYLNADAKKVEAENELDRYIYGRNADGLGDSLRVTLNKASFNLRSARGFHLYPREQDLVCYSLAKTNLILMEVRKTLEARKDLFPALAIARVASAQDLMQGKYSRCYSETNPLTESDFIEIDDTLNQKLNGVLNYFAALSIDARLPSIHDDIEQAGAYVELHKKIEDLQHEAEVLKEKLH